MSCPCGSENFVVENNWKTCTECGLENSYEPKYFVSYALPRHEYRRQYYSRAKRFTKVLLDMKNEFIAKHFEEILELYALVEFHWINNRKKKRKYFFSQKIILWYILKQLGIPLEVPVLKNVERSREQILSISKILSEMEGVVFTPEVGY